MLGVGRTGPLASFAASSGADGSGGTVVPFRRPRRDAVAEREALAVLVSVSGLGPVTLGGLVRALGSPAGVLAVARGSRGAQSLVAASLDAGERRELTVALAREIVTAADQAERILAPIRRSGLRLLSLDDPDYPARLRAIELPPPLLFVRGEVAALSAERAVAVVGTRRPTEAGMRIAYRIGGMLAQHGVVVVSGLARGIDGAAHDAVVQEQGVTVAVLGGGHERLFPASHRSLATRIEERGGAIISEQLPQTRPEAWTFPRRNRIIAGLSESTIVVEAGMKSGALITAAWALEQGRDCFLVPGSLGAPTSAGCLAFLRECPGAARVISGYGELLEDLGLVEGVRIPRARGRRDRTPLDLVRTVDSVLAEMTGTALSVGRALVAGLATVDELVATLDLPVATILAALTILEDHGLVVAAYGRYRPAGLLATAQP